MRFGFVGGSYTGQSSAVANEECINWFAETNEDQPLDVAQAYGGKETVTIKSYYGTPGLSIFTTFPSGPVRGQYLAPTGGLYVVADDQLYHVDTAGTQTPLGDVVTDGNAVSFCANSIQLLFVSGGRAYCVTLATNALIDVTSQLAGVPMQCDCSDTLGVIIFQNSNKFQVSQVLDFSTWPGQLVSEVSVFADFLVSVIVNHRELWLFGATRSQPYQDTGSTEAFDVIQGTLIENGCAATFSVARLDNSVFWIGNDEHGAAIAWRSNGYTPVRVSTHAVELWLSQQGTNLSKLVSYSYQDRGHLFWVLYVPGGDCSWVYDVGEGLWHKRATWVGTHYIPHQSWNHCSAFGKHLVGDWNSANLYQLSFDNLTDNGATIRRLRRPPTVTNEKEWIYHTQIVVDFETGLGPQPPLKDGDGNPRQPQAILRWSDNRGKTWSNWHTRDCGFAGDFATRVLWMRLGRSRNRVYELVVSDPIPWTIVDAYLKAE